MPPTRFVCLSDTHGYTPSEAGFKLPPGDVLIHAGDLTNNGTIAELERTIEWISKSDYEIKIIVAGNHDITLDPSLDTTHGSIHRQNSEDPAKYIDLVTSSSSIVYLTHQSAVIRLSRPDGPKTIFKVFGSPYSSRMSESWAAFTYAATNDADDQWSRIPSDADVVVTHTPPYSHLDSRSDGNSTGCKSLHKALKRTRPSLSVCGHVHESRGFERVSWGSDIGAQEQIIQGVLPPFGSKKQSLVDLTGKKERKLDNHGRSFPSQSRSVMALPAEEHGPIDSSHENTRQETCIVNAATLASSWPHRCGKKFNAPVVVDLDLPTAQVDQV